MTIANSEDLDVSGFQDPIAVRLRPVDDEGAFAAEEDGVVVFLEGANLFRDEGQVPADMRQLEDAFKLAASKMGLPEERVAIADFDFVDAPRTTWLVDADWDEGEGHYAETVMASNDQVALALCAMKMGADDDGRPDFTTGPALFDYAVECAVECAGGYGFHPPIPHLATDERVKEMVAVVVAAAGQGSPAVDEVAAFASATFHGRRGDAANDGDVLVVFASENPEMEDLETVIPAAEFDDAVGDMSFKDGMNKGRLADLLEAKAKDVASRHVDYDAYESDSEYMDDLDRAQESLRVESVGKVGELKIFNTVGHYEDDDGIFEEVVMAVDKGDACLQAAIRMADVDEAGRDGLDMIGWSLEGNDISAELLPFDLDEARDRLRALCASGEEMPAPVREVVEEFRQAAQDYDFVMANRHRPKVDEAPKVSAPRP